MATEYPPIWDFEKHGALLEGEYVAAYPNMGRFHNTIFVIKDKQGKKWGIWGTSNIKLALQMRDYGKKVRIQFLGRIIKGNKNHVMAFKINIGRGREAATTEHDRGPRQKRKGVAGVRMPTRQQEAEPLLAVGRGHATVPAAKKIKIKIKKYWDNPAPKAPRISRIGPRKAIAIPLPPPDYQPDEIELKPPRRKIFGFL